MPRGEPLITFAIRIKPALKERLAEIQSNKIIMALEKCADENSKTEPSKTEKIDALVKKKEILRKEIDGYKNRLCKIIFNSSLNILEDRPSMVRFKDIVWGNDIDKLSEEKQAEIRPIITVYKEKVTQLRALDEAMKKIGD